MNNQAITESCFYSIPMHFRQFSGSYIYFLCYRTATLLFLFALAGGCAGWQVNGVSVADIAAAGPGETAEMAAGAVGAVVVHWMGHVVYAEAAGLDWHQDGLHEVIAPETSMADTRNFGRAGFVAQLATGTLLKFSPWRDTWWAIGYQAGAAAETLKYYPAGNGDLEILANANADADAEWAAYSAWAVFNLISTPIESGNPHSLFSKPAE